MAEYSNIATRANEPLRAAGAAESLYADNLGPGAQVGNYVVERLRARGGFASVYRARHVTLDRVAALKILHRELSSSPIMLQRFMQEAKAVNLVHHPNIVDIYEFGDFPDGRPYLVMEWLEGHDLEQELRERGPIPVADVLAIMEDLGSALTAAHRLGIVHRDLKASNVMSVPCGSWFSFKLLDFGIAKLIDDTLGSADLTTTGLRLGTPTNMAPEQIRAKQIDARTDVYALGVLLYQLLTGRLPFNAPTAAEIEDLHLNAPPPRASKTSSVPSSIDDVIARCMRKDPAQRYQSIEECIGALRRAKEAPAAQSGLTSAPAIALHFRARIFDSLPEDQIGDDVLDDLDEVLQSARRHVAQGGLLLAAEGTSDRLAILLLGEGDDAQREASRKMLEVALSLKDVLDRRACRSEHVRYSIAVDLGQVRLRARADGPELIGGTLLTPTHWEGERVAGLTDGEIVASEAVIAALGAALEHVGSATPFQIVRALRDPPS